MSNPGQPRLIGLKHHKPRMIGDLILATELAVAAVTNRHRRTVVRYCEPIACDVMSRLPLYDVDEAASTLKAVARRYRRVA